MRFQGPHNAFIYSSAPQSVYYCSTTLYCMWGGGVSAWILFHAETNHNNNRSIFRIFHYAVNQQNNVHSLFRILANKCSYCLFIFSEILYISMLLTLPKSKKKLSLSLLSFYSCFYSHNKPNLPLLAQKLQHFHFAPPDYLLTANTTYVPWFLPSWGSYVDDALEAFAIKWNIHPTEKFLLQNFVRWQTSNRFKVRINAVHKWITSGTLFPRCFAGKGTLVLTRWCVHLGNEDFWESGDISW